MKPKVKAKHVAGKANLFNVSLPKQKKGEPVKALSTNNAVSLIGPKGKGKSRQEFEREGKLARKKKALGEAPSGSLGPKKKAKEASPPREPRKGGPKKGGGLGSLPRPGEEGSSYPPRKKKASKDVSDFDEGEETATEDQLTQIKNEAKKAVALEKQVADLEAATVNIKKERDEILNKTLPSLLDSAGMTSFNLADGSLIEIKDVVSGSLPSADKKPEEREAALKWLRKNGGAALIKTNFLTEFGMGQEKLAAFFKALIIKNKFLAKESIGVHPQTLCAFVREKLEHGEEVPVEKLGIYTGRHAKIKLSDEVLAEAETNRVRPKGRKS